MRDDNDFSRLLVVMLLMGSVSGCSPLQEKKSAPTLNVVELIIRGDYAQAKVVAQQQEESNPEALEQINTVIGNYKSALPERLEDHINHQRWEEIHKLLAQAEWRIPGSPELNAAQARWKIIQSEQQQRLEIQRLIIDSEALHANIVMDRQLLRMAPLDLSISSRLEKHIEKSKIMAAKLMQIGERALMEGHLVLAQQSLPLAHKLNWTPESKVATTELENILAQQQQEALELKWKSLAEQKRREFQWLVAELAGSLAKEQLVRATSLLKQAEAIESDSGELKKLKLQLQRRVEQVIEKNLEQGIKHYRQEKFAKAIENWDQVLKLDPDHKQARINILRAENVVSNLERLIEKGEQ